jgi:mobilome CxxCx(11)CxxC protein
MDVDQIRKDCWGFIFHTYGTIRLFEKRAKHLQTGRTWITFLGVVVPVVVGGVVLGFGADMTSKDVFKYLLYSAGSVGLIQLILSTWSIVSRWDEKYEYAMKSVVENTKLYNDWDDYRKRQIVDNAESEQKFNDIKSRTDQQEFRDISQNISDKEKRFATRSALFYFKQQCHVCNEVPKDMKPGKCSGCGNF